jgi:hypothetical protein
MSIPFQTINWDQIDRTVHTGIAGVAYWRTRQYENVRVRLVEYSANYTANHWCRIGHIIHCIEGELISELSDGRIFTLTSGMSYVVSDDLSMHRSHTKKGVKLLIIDGAFLANKTDRNPWKI